jgi:hypothetical protein
VSLLATIDVSEKYAIRIQIDLIDKKLSALVWISGAPNIYAKVRRLSAADIKKTKHFISSTKGES